MERMCWYSTGSTGRNPGMLTIAATARKQKKKERKARAEFLPTVPSDVQFCVSVVSTMQSHDTGPLLRML